MVKKSATQSEVLTAGRSGTSWGQNTFRDAAGTQSLNTQGTVHSPKHAGNCPSQIRTLRALSVHNPKHAGHCPSQKRTCRQNIHTQQTKNFNPPPKKRKKKGRKKRCCLQFLIQVGKLSQEGGSQVEVLGC